MIQTLVNFFRTKEVRNKIFFTLAMLVIFKIGTYIPAPGVNPAAFDNPQGSQGATELLNTFGGGALKRFSIFAMGIVPYITASIVMQLLQMDIVPKFSEWAKQGEVGRRKLNNVTRYLAISLAFIQSIGMAFQFNNYLKGALIINQSIMSYLLIALVLTAGTAFLMNRNKMNHYDKHVLALCREHHNEQHAIGVKSFDDKYHLHDSWIKVDERLNKMLKGEKKE